MTPPTTTTSESNTLNTLNTHPLPHVASISGVQEFAAAAQQQQQPQDDRTRTKVPSTSARITPIVNSTTLSQPKACSTSDNTTTSTTTLTLLSSAQSGARVLFATDEWFASAENLLQDTEPVFDPDAFGPQGKVMDGWETRRRREAGHDWCIVRLCQRGTIHTLTIDTAYFTGNHVPQIQLQIADLTNAAQEAAWVAQLPGAVERLLYYNNNHNNNHNHSPQGTGATPDQVTQAEQATSGSTIVWRDLLPQSPLQPGYADTRYHHWTVEEPMTGTHVRVNYYPDGGVARLRLYGTPVVPGVAPAPRPLYSPIVTGRTCSVLRHPDNDDDEEAVTLEEENDNQKRSSSTSVVLFSQRPTFPELSRGGRGVACSNQHYGVPDNLLRTALGRDMGDGWETARHVHRPAVWRKDPVSQLLHSDLSDWCVLELGQVAASVQAIVLDTKHFRGNYPESVLVEGAYYRCSENDNNNTDDRIEDWEWFPLVPRGRMAPDAEHLYEAHQSYVDHHQQVTTQIVNSERPVSHVRVTLFPDGGLSRVRVYGIPMTS